MSYPTKRQRPTPIGAAPLLTVKTHSHPKRNQYKPLPMFAKEFAPASGMIPAIVFIGSHEAIKATKIARANGDHSRVCIKPGDNPNQFSWGFLHSLPVLVYAEDDLPRETVIALVTELARCGASHIAAMRISGAFIAFYSPEAGRDAA